MTRAKGKAVRKAMLITQDGVTRPITKVEAEEFALEAGRNYGDVHTEYWYLVSPDGQIGELTDLKLVAEAKNNGMHWQNDAEGKITWVTYETGNVFSRTRITNRYAVALDMAREIYKQRVTEAQQHLNWLDNEREHFTCPDCLNRMSMSRGSSKPECESCLAVSQ